MFAQEEYNGVQNRNAADHEIIFCEGQKKPPRILRQQLYAFPSFYFGFLDPTQTQ